MPALSVASAARLQWLRAVLVGRRGVEATICLRNFRYHLLRRADLRRQW
jgi:hypothetical protein